MDIENFELDADHVGHGVEEGSGHWHAFVDDAYVGFATDGSISISGVEVGEHLLRVELYNHDHTELDQRVFDEVIFNVR